MNSFLTIFSISTFKSAQTFSERCGIFVSVKYNSMRNAGDCTVRWDANGKGGGKRQEEEATPVMLSIALYIKALTSHRPCPKQEGWRGNWEIIWPCATLKQQWKFLPAVFIYLFLFFLNMFTATKNFTVTAQFMGQPPPRTGLSQRITQDWNFRVLRDHISRDPSWGVLTSKS